MNSFKADTPKIPAGAVWLLSDISEYKGKQELYTKQSPQVLKSLAEMALIESAESSNRIEGVTVDHDRLKPLVIGHSKPRDRSEERHGVGVNIFNTMGGYCPTMGIIGTVVGLIAALAQAGNSEGGAEGAKAIIAAIATAFIATFYGIGAANLLFLPLGSKLKAKSTEEVFTKQLIIEAVKSIQNGENPRGIRDKLTMFFRKGTIKTSEKQAAA